MEPIEVDVPLDIKMGDRLENIVELHNLQQLGDTGWYILAPENGLPTMFEFISFDSSPYTGIARIRLVTGDRKDEGEQAYLRDWEDLKAWLSRKYGEGDVMTSEEEPSIVSIRWSVRHRTVNSDRHQGGHVAFIQMIGDTPNDDYYSMGLTYAFINGPSCDEANQRDKFRGL